MALTLTNDLQQTCFLALAYLRNLKNSPKVVTGENQQEAKGTFVYLGDYLVQYLIPQPIFLFSISESIVTEWGPTLWLASHKVWGDNSERNTRWPRSLSSQGWESTVGDHSEDIFLTSTISKNVCLQKKDLPLALLYWDVLGLHFPGVHSQHFFFPPELNQNAPSYLVFSRAARRCWL